MLTHCVAPVPLTTNHFNSKTRLAYLIIERVYKRQGGKRNQCHNNRGLNRPNQLQCCVVIKTLRHCLHSVVKTLNNAGSQPQNQNQNNNLEKADVSVQVRNTLHVGSCWVLKHLLPCHWSIGPYYTPVPYHTIHCIHSFCFASRRFCSSCSAPPCPEEALCLAWRSQSKGSAPCDCSVLCALHLLALRRRRSARKPSNAGGAKRARHARPKAAELRDSPRAIRFDSLLFCVLRKAKKKRTESARSINDFGFGNFEA